MMLIRIEIECGEDNQMSVVIADGVEPVFFKFGEREPEEDFISEAVPVPYAQVDLGEAWRISQLDARACELTLERDHSLEATLRVYANTIRWLRFWSDRYPQEEWRQRFRWELAAREAGLKRLKRRAELRFELEMVEELSNI